MKTKENTSGKFLVRLRSIRLKEVLEDNDTVSTCLTLPYTL